MKLELNKTYCMNCIDGMKLLPDNYVDLTITSPPYDDLRSYNGTLKWNFDIFKDIANELYRVTKDGGVIVWVVGDKTKDGSETGTSFNQALYFKEIGFKLHDTMIYMKKTPPLTHNRYEQEFEYMFILVKGKLKTFNPIMIPKKYMDNRTKKSFGRDNTDKHVIGFSSEKTMKIKGNVWEFLVGGGKTTKDKIAFKHPAIFPEKLCDDHIKSWSNKGDIVMDIFSGSGTTHKMCLLNDRKYIGFELFQEYIYIENERLKENNLQ